MNEKNDCFSNKSGCDELQSFKKLILGVMGLQTTIVIVTLTMSVSITKEQSKQNSRITEMAAFQKSLERRITETKETATAALAMSGKADANIAWIREGLTELKLSVRKTRYDERN